MPLPTYQLSAFDSSRSSSFQLCDGNLAIIADRLVNIRMICLLLPQDTGQREVDQESMNGALFTFSEPTHLGDSGSAE